MPARSLSFSIHKRGTSPTVSHRLRRLVRNCSRFRRRPSNFNDDSWKQMFQDSTFQYVLDDEDEERLIVESTDYEQANELLSQMQRVATALDNATPPQVLPVAPPPLSTPLPPPREQVATPPPVVVPPPPATPLLTPREVTPQPPAPTAPQLPTQLQSNSSSRRRLQFVLQTKATTK
ncbi:hypothetical protein MHU86_4519 [Fragilaria crotonensis]|nr:hypothetical protein MHU86_4519 [Fragilaria crotonensis]